jgi:hypothetical protein
MKHRCKCEDCGQLVDKWIGMVCIPCHDTAIKKPIESKMQEFKIAWFQQIDATG